VIFEEKGRGLMEEGDLRKYWERVTEGKPAEAKAINPAGVVTAPWVRLKCQFGCIGYGKGHCCPPETPTPEQMRKVLESYGRAILFHFVSEKGPSHERKHARIDFLEALVDLEGEMFKDGYYKALAILAGPCSLCTPCGKTQNEPCRFGHRARPSMEACGIDVYATARGNGFEVHPLKEKGETQKVFCLLLVD
jgi:predicted metal-binding protein